MPELISRLGQMRTKSKPGLGSRPTEEQSSYKDVCSLQLIDKLDMQCLASWTCSCATEKQLALHVEVASQSFLDLDAYL